jgi:hypothetical protein
MFNFLQYHCLNGNKTHVLKVIELKLIGAQVGIPNICTFEKTNKK